MIRLSVDNSWIEGWINQVPDPHHGNPTDGTGAIAVRLTYHHAKHHIDEWLHRHKLNRLDNNDNDWEIRD